MKKKTLMELLIVVQCLSHSITLAWVRLQKTIMEAKGEKTSLNKQIKRKSKA